MFYDRYEAGRELAEQLVQYASTDAIVCAIPRGGVLTGLSVAKRLELPLELMVVTKVEQIVQDEPLYCVVTEFGEYQCGSDQPLSEFKVQRGMEQAQENRLAYTDSEELPVWRDKTVIVVDDGAESGLTIKATVLALLAQEPIKIIVALPAASVSVTQWLEAHVDEVVVVKVEPEFEGFIKEHYSHYPEVFEKEVHIAYWHAKHIYQQNYK